MAGREGSEEAGHTAWRSLFFALSTRDCPAPSEPATEDKLTRRRFLVRAGGLVALASIPVACGNNGSVSITSITAAQAATVFRLSTAGAACTGTRCSCHACEKHAANKLFATRAAADTNRAHQHCNCTIVQETLAPEKWKALFGDPAGPERTHVDLRDPQVQQLLA